MQAGSCGPVCVLFTHASLCLVKRSRKYVRGFKMVTISLELMEPFKDLYGEQNSSVALEHVRTVL